MKDWRLIKDERGVTLIEITLAVAIFAGVIGVTAQSLMSFYVSIDVQEQRMEAIAKCRGVMDAIREKRLQFKTNFPDGVVAWVNTNNDSSWSTFAVDNSEHVELANQTINVACYNLAGEAPSTGDNPIEVHVTTNWLDRKGRPISSTLVSMITSE